MLQWNFLNVSVTALVLISLLLITLRVNVPARTNLVEHASSSSKADMDVWILAGQSNMVGTNEKVWTQARAYADTCCISAYGQGTLPCNHTGRSTHAPSSPAMARQDNDVQSLRQLDQRNPQRTSRDPFVCRSG